MSENQLSDILAQAITAEGVDTVFTLMGDANMELIGELADRGGMRLVFGRHEQGVVAMADGYTRFTGLGQDYAEVVYAAKIQIMREDLAAEVQSLRERVLRLEGGLAEIRAELGIEAR